jgi:hypothetical protein
MIIESSPKVVSILYDIVVGVVNVSVALHVTSSNLMNGVKSKVSMIYCSM